MTCRRLVGLVLAALAGLAAAAGYGCGSGVPLKPCGEIPEGGCPTDRGGSCKDRVCAGLYDCIDGKWIEIEPCPPPMSDGGTEAADGGDAGPDGSCKPVMIDHLGEATGCAPSLQTPDCPLAIAETCSPDPCRTDCTDFFLCTNDGWTEVAHCDEQGQIVVTQ